MKRTTITLETATMNDLHVLAKLNKRSLSSEVAIAVARWLIMNSAVVAQAKSSKPSKKCQS
jgi:hypothetical protein